MSKERLRWQERLPKEIVERVARGLVLRGKTRARGRYRERVRPEEDIDVDKFEIEYSQRRDRIWENVERDVQDCAKEDGEGNETENNEGE